MTIAFNRLPELEPEPRDAVIFDLDKVLSVATIRSYGFKDNHLVDTDIPNPVGSRYFKMIRKLNPEIAIIILTGRNVAAQELTMKWLKENDLVPDLLVMRPTHVYLKSAEMKAKLMEEYIKGKFNVLMAYDDNPECLSMYQELGIPTRLVVEC